MLVAPPQKSHCAEIWAAISPESRMRRSRPRTGAIIAPGVRQRQQPLLAAWPRRVHRPNRRQSNAISADPPNDDSNSTTPRIAEA